VSALALAALAAPGASGAGTDPADAVLLAPPPHGRVYHAAFPRLRRPREPGHHWPHPSLRARGRAAARLGLFLEQLVPADDSLPARQGRADRPHRRRPVHSDDAPLELALGAGPQLHAGERRRRPLGSHLPGIVPWCEGATAYGRPLLVEFGTEVNNGYFPWSGRFNGGGHDRDGDGVPDGPERFVAAYRYIADTCRAVGAGNITWFFHVDVGTWPQPAWNRIANY
jgi:hypothetical protein